LIGSFSGKDMDLEEFILTAFVEKGQSWTEEGAVAVIFNQLRWNGGASEDEIRACIRALIERGLLAVLPDGNVDVPIHVKDFAEPRPLTPTKKEGEGIVFTPSARALARALLEHEEEVRENAWIYQGVRDGLLWRFYPRYVIPKELVRSWL